MQVDDAARNVQSVVPWLAALHACLKGMMYRLSCKELIQSSSKTCSCISGTIATPQFHKQAAVLKCSSCMLLETRVASHACVTLAVMPSCVVRGEPSVWVPPMQQLAWVLLTAAAACVGPLNKSYVSNDTIALCATQCMRAMGHPCPCARLRSVPQSVPLP